MPTPPCPPACPHCLAARRWRFVFRVWFLLPLLPIVVTFAALSLSAITRPRPEPIQHRPVVAAPPSTLETFLRTTNEDLDEMSHALNAVSRMRRTHGEQALP